jgi:hypothetical protein
MMVQAAASYGDQNPTGRRPGYRRWISPTTGSSSPTPGNPEPSTSSDRIRSTCGRTSATRSAPGFAGLTISASTFSPAWLTRTPTVRQLPSAGNASSSIASGALGYDAGVNPSRNLMLAASENGPRGTSVNASIPSSHHAPPTFPLVLASAVRLTPRMSRPRLEIRSYMRCDT